jgi:L-lactate dehydrogenase complex protein LldG
MTAVLSTILRLKLNGIVNVSASKENILKKIRKALSESTPIPFPQSEGNNTVFRASEPDLALQFAEEFTGLLGKFSFCQDNTELSKQLFHLLFNNGFTRIFCTEPLLKDVFLKEDLQLNFSTDLKNCDVSITSCECLVARTGSILLSSAQQDGRTASVYAPVHICIAYTNQLVYDVKDALLLIREKYDENLPSLLSFATGPSRTADIEKTLVVGVHGPKEVYVFLVEAAE